MSDESVGRMRVERWQQIEELLGAALECDDGARAAFIERACAGDADLRREVESLFAHEIASEGFAKAEKILREALALREENLPKGHFMTALTEGALGECLTAQQKYADAEPLLLASYESLMHSQAGDNPRTSLAKRRLCELYTASGKPKGVICKD